MTRIYCIRHAEAEGNTYRRAHGQYNSLLTPNGLRQVEALAQRFASGEPVDAVYASDLYRARTTAKALGRPVTVVPQLREVCLGEWEDLPWGEIAARYPLPFHTFNQEPHRFTAPGGEPMHEAVRRMRRVFDELARQHSGQTIALVSHGLALRALFTVVCGHPLTYMPETPHMDNTAVSLFEYARRGTAAVFLRDNTHLGQELSTLARQNWWRKESPLRDVNLTFRAARFPEDDEFIESAHREIWLSLYGTEKGFDGSAYLRQAHTLTVRIAEHDGKVAGVLILDPASRLRPDSGHIFFVYLAPWLRSRGIGVQLLGEAVSQYRNMGRRELTLKVSQRNKTALRFYGRCGFTEFDREQGQFCPQLLLSMNIHVD